MKRKLFTKKTFAAVLPAALTAAFLPEVSQAGAIEDGAQWVLDILTGGLARTAAIIAVAILGYLAWFREFDKAKAVWIVVGIVAVFGGASIVDLIIAAVS